MPRFNCPRCSTSLSEVRLDGLRLYLCSTCQGHAINVSQLRPRLPDGAIAAMWRTARAMEACGPGCAVCGRAMRVIEVGTAAIEVDVCTGCQMLWLDAGEQEKLGVTPEPVRTAPPLSPEQLEATVLLAEAKVASDAARYHQEKTARRVWWLGELVEALLWASV